MHKISPTSEDFNWWFPPGDRQRGGLPRLPGRRRSPRRGAGADDGAGSQHGGEDGVSGGGRRHPMGTWCDGDMMGI